MRIKFCLFTVIILFYFPLAAQVSYTFPSAVSVANASVAEQNEWSAYQNTAALAHVENGEIAMQYENRFIIKELSSKSVQAALNAKYVNIGAAFSYFGYALYNDMILGVGAARNFGNKFSMGVQLNYYAAYFSGKQANRYRATIFPQFGISSRIFPKLTIGFHAFNPFQSNIQTEYTVKRISSIYSIGANYTFAEKLIWLTQIDKEVSSRFRFASGAEYTMMDALTVKIGAYAVDYLVPCVGANVHLNKFHIYLNGELHPQLGLNTQVCLKYRY